MDFQLGAEVRQSDGGKLGEIQRVIVDLETDQVVSLVVFESRVDGHEVVVPIGLVESADDGAVGLGIGQDQFESLEGFAQSINIAPPPDAANVGIDDINDPIDVPDVLPIGAATGIESIAYTPVIEEMLNVPQGDVLLDGDTIVYATDGEIGRVLSVRVNDETERVESLLATHGLLIEHHVEVPWSAVRSVQPHTVILSAVRADLRELDND